MEHSRLPLPSLLGLFGALLMLSPELLLGMPEGLSDLPVSDPGVQKTLALAVEEYNRYSYKNANYFKVLRVMQAQSQVKTREEYHFTLEVTKTTCKKMACCKLSYKKIQMCKQLVRNQQQQTCYLKILFRFIVSFQIVSCT